MKPARGWGVKGDPPGRVQVDTEHHNANASQNGSTGSKRQAIYSELFFFLKKSGKFFLFFLNCPRELDPALFLGFKLGKHDIRIGILG